MYTSNVPSIAFLHGREYTLGEERGKCDNQDDSLQGNVPSFLSSTFIQHVQELPAVLEMNTAHDTL